MKNFFNKAAMQNHPLRELETFLDQEKANETAKNYDAMRFVGYVLDIGYDTITIITSDPFKVAVGGVPRNSLLIMVPANMDSFPPHFTLLRVLEAAPTPLSQSVQQTYFELQKKSMPELDVFTQSELQWGALKTGVLGMFYPHQDEVDKIEFSGDINNFVSAHKYRIYSPNTELLDLIVNSLVPNKNRFQIGSLRLTENRLGLPNKSQPNTKVLLSTDDFKGTRTAMFGKTRLGKSNVVKLIAQSLIETTLTNASVGQLIFDVNGEYANDNPQDGNKSIRSSFPSKCEVYALTPKINTPSKPLKLNFYEQPESSKRIIGSLLNIDNKLTSNYVNSFASVELSTLEAIKKLPSGGDRVRAVRRLLMYWAILSKAGFPVNEQQLNAIAPSGNNQASKFDTGFKSDLRNAAYSAEKISPTPGAPNSLGTLVRELEIINKFRKNNMSSPLIASSSGSGPLFEADDISLLEFLDPQPGRSGVSLIQPYKIYHDQNASDFVNEILKLLDKGQTVILDLGNANEIVMKYFSNELSISVFRHQVEKFTTNNLGDHYIQLYFEEAHNLFPSNNEPTDTYSRFAKEGAKYHIGMVYSTQSPSTIYKDLLAQTENFFVAHLSSREEVNALAKLNVAYDSLRDDILMAKTPGYMRMLTRSNRFVISLQARKFSP